MKTIALLALLVTNAAFADEHWQRVPHEHDIWHFDLASVKHTETTATIRMRLSLYEDVTVNSVVYTEEFKCNGERSSKTLAIRFYLDGTVMDDVKEDPAFESYYIPSVWERARKVACAP